MVRNKIFYNKIFIIFILLFGLTACATDNLAKLYDGDKKPDSEIAKIQLPTGLEVKTIDGKEIKTPYIYDGFQPIGLLPGKHKIWIFYKEHWGTAYVGEVVTSDIFEFNLNLEAGKIYYFKHNGPKDVVADTEMTPDDIKIWFFQPDEKITIQASRQLAYGNFAERAIMSVIGYSATAESTNQSETPSNELEQLQSYWKAADDRQRGAFKSWVVSRSTTAKPSSTAEKNNSNTKSADNDAYQKLQYWWKMADDKQRKAFSDWIAKRSIDGKGLL